MSLATDSFHWTEAYSVNIAALDRQHQKLFETVNELNRALRSGAANDALDPILDQLMEYATVHFAAEESLMEQYEFPGLSTHRTQHEMFRQQIAVFLAEHTAAKPGVPVSLMFFMQDWLKRHLLQTDKLYSAFLNARGVR